MDLRSSIDSSTMMLDWNEQDQVGETLWPDVLMGEGHIVPYPMESEDDPLFRFGDYSTNKKNEAVTIDVGSTEQSPGAKNEDLSYRSESRYSFQTGEELSSSRTNMDPWWFDFPHLCVEFRDDFPVGNSHSSVTELMNDLSDASNLNSWRGDSMQLDCDPELLGHGDKENGDFVDCNWDAFGDFDDVEKLFRKNDAMFGYEMIGNDDGFLSPSTDVINSTAQSIPLPDLPLCNDQTSNEGCSYLCLEDRSEKQRSVLRKEKMCGDAKLMEHCGSSKQVSFNQHGYPVSCFSGMQLPPHFQADGSQKRPVSSSYVVRLDEAQHQKNSNRVLDSKPTIMTPQEKKEKLRRLQKIQAQLVIEQQHQQFTPVQNNQVLDSVTSTAGTDECAQRVLSLELNMPSEKHKSKGASCLRYDSPLEETIYYQLQDVVEKLDMRIRFCIRDSLLRLARSAMERQNVNGSSSTNKNSKEEDEVSADEELSDRQKSTTLADAETDTNPIDRIVASLLFQGTTQACPGASSYELLGSTQYSLFS